MQCLLIITTLRTEQKPLNHSLTAVFFLYHHASGVYLGEGSLGSKRMFLDVVASLAPTPGSLSTGLLVGRTHIQILMQLC